MTTSAVRRTFRSAERRPSDHRAGRLEDRPRQPDEPGVAGQDEDGRAASGNPRAHGVRRRGWPNRFVCGRRERDARGGEPRAFPGSVRNSPIPRKPTGSGRIAVALVQLEVHVEHIDQLLADRAAPRRVRLFLEKGFDVLAHVVGFQLLVVRPFGGDAVKWNSAFASVMSGSRPEAEAVTRSPGTSLRTTSG